MILRYGYNIWKSTSNGFPEKRNKIKRRDWLVETGIPTLCGGFPYCNHIKIVHFLSRKTAQYGVTFLVIKSDDLKMYASRHHALCFDRSKTRDFSWPPGTCLKYIWVIQHKLLPRSVKVWCLSLTFERNERGKIFVAIIYLQFEPMTLSVLIGPCVCNLP